MNFDSKELAVGWLSVATASAKTEDYPALNKTVYVEQFPTGIRLVSTDSYMLLRCWVPSEGNELEPEPRIDEAPDTVAVVMDPDSRGKGLLNYAKTLWERAMKREDPDLPVTVRLTLHAADPNISGLQLGGMETQFAVLDLADTEKVLLPIFDGTYPDWRPLMADLKSDSSSHVALSGAMLKRLSAVAALHPGSARIGCVFSGPLRPIYVQVIDGEPFVEGLVMPCRWDVDNNRPLEDESERAEVQA